MTIPWGLEKQVPLFVHLLCCSQTQLQLWILQKKSIVLESNYNLPIIIVVKKVGNETIRWLSNVLELKLNKTFFVRPKSNACSLLIFQFNWKDLTYKSRYRFPTRIFLLVFHSITPNCNFQCLWRNHKWVFR